MHPLLKTNLFFVKEHLGLFKASSNYDIYDPESKQLLFQCREIDLNIVSKLLRFTGFKRCTPFDIQITTENSERVLKLKKGISLFLSRVSVYDENEKKVGYLKQRLFPLGNNFDVFDVNDTLICSLNGSLFAWDFKFVRNQEAIGTVTKKWAGIGKELFTTADNYILEINSSVAKDDLARLMMVASVLCIDMVIKE
ncbi:MAG: phospholipid scramblase-related protein [Flavobacteriaceae bacterium]|tara:strand:- start:525 stop:1112 length:588 start_codon:yes stop_codon:yes gene_type:complete